MKKVIPTPEVPAYRPRQTMSPNDMAYWYPRIQLAVPTPRTVILAGYDVREMFNIDAGKPSREFARLARDVSLVSPSMGTPFFLRASTFSGKHEWKNTCCVPSHDPAVIEKHAANIMYMGECVGVPDMAWDSWVVREFLKPHPDDIAFVAKGFDDMPVRREFRVFVRNSDVVCIHPYWPNDCFHEELSSQMTADLARISDIGSDESAVRAMASTAGAALGGEWSIDCLRREDGSWCVTDCAVAGNSWHWPDCKAWVQP